jgi:hypothetical protein
MTSDLPYLAQGPLAEAFAEQTNDFAFLYDRGTFAAWVGTRWSIGDPENLVRTITAACCSIRVFGRA